LSLTDPETLKDFRFGKGTLGSPTMPKVGTSQPSPSSRDKTKEGMIGNTNTPLLLFNINQCTMEPNQPNYSQPLKEARQCFLAAQQEHLDVMEAAIQEGEEKARKATIRAGK
jgi:hypothetical protein